MIKIPKDLYNAYTNWNKAEKRATDSYNLFEILIKKYLGLKYDKLAHGKLIVDLTKKRIAEED